MKRLLQFSLTITAIIALVISCAKEEPELTKYVLTITASDGGKVSTPGGTYVEGETARITATADSGYIFVRWSNGSTDNPLVFTVNSNVSIQAIFEKETYSASIGGAVAKGAYVAGSDITFYELNDALEQTGKSYSTNTTDDIGTFSLNVQEITEDYARVQGDGYYWNEVTGETSPDRLRLNAISNVKENINVNILTHLEYDRVIELVKNQGKSFADAKAQAVDEVLSSLGIEISQNYGNAESYNFRDGNEASKVLLAASAVVVADKSSSEISSLITKIANDIKDNGNIDTESINTEIADKLHTIDISAIAANVYERYKEANENLTAESFESPYIEIIESEFQNFIPDADGDGVHDDIDLCPDTPEGEEADENGCSYTQKQYELDTNTIGLGSISEEVVTTTSRSTHDYGTTVRLTANPIKGWQFVAWSGDVESTDNPIEVSVDKDLSVTATFEPIPYEITISVEGEGEVTQKVITVADAENENTIIELTATPSDEWVFSEWKGAIESSDNPLNITMNENKEITAVFVKKQYELTVEIEGEGTVAEELISETDKSYESGSTVKLTATGNEGWQFKSWSGDIESTENPVEININSVKTVKAIFEKKDTDGDGVVDIDDVCPETPEGESVNASGCSDYIYLDDNGVTIKAKEYANIGDSKEIDGVTYTVVDEATLRQMVADDEDVTKVVTSKVTDMQNLFADNTSFNQNISSWDTSLVTNMAFMFAGDDIGYNLAPISGNAHKFNQSLSFWNTSNVDNMSGMFYHSEFNNDISNWDVSKVILMNNMFQYNTNFNQDISNWNTSSLIQMSKMFTNAYSFNSNISNWDVSNVTDMGWLFLGAKEFNQDISNWDVSSVISFVGMFYGALKFNQPIGNWDTSSVTNLGFMFREANSFNQDISNWDVSNVTTTYLMFGFNEVFNQDISNWDVSNVSNMDSMFSSSVFNKDISGWNVSNVTNMRQMFANASEFSQDLSSWCVNNIETLPENFSVSSGLSLEQLPVWGTCPLEDDSDGDGVVDYLDQCSDTPEGATVDENGCQIAPIYLDDNGVTIKARDFANVGDTWELDGIKYTIVDEATLRQMVADDEDVTKVVTTKITNMSSLFNEKTLFNQDISSWDTSKVIDMSGMFNEASIFNSDISKWDTSSVSNMEVMFRRAKAFNINIGDWNTSKVTNLRLMFADADAFNQPIGTWDVSKVSNMSSMFSDADSFNNDLSNWNVSNVVNMGEMFADADSFNKPIDTWNVSNVKYMNSMFFKSDNFNQSLNNWDVSKVLNMSQMFSEASLFDGEISSWDVSNVSNMAAMFSLAKEFNQDISNWDVSKVENMNAMFYYAVNFNNNISSWCVKNIISEPERFNSDGGILNPNFKPVWGQCGEIYLDDNGVTIKARDNAVAGESYKLTNDGDEYLVVDEATLRQMVENDEDLTKVVTSKVESIYGLFRNNTTFNQDISSWDTSNITTMHALFEGAVAFNQDIGKWNTSKVKDMQRLFGGAVAFNYNIGDWDTSSVTDMSFMFKGNTSFNKEIGNWDVSKVITMYHMFAAGASFNQDISSWNVSSVTNMGEMFGNNFAFNQDISSWDVSKVTNMAWMFHNGVFNQPIGDWDVSSVTDMNHMFRENKKFNQDISNWDVSKVLNFGNMFANATQFNQDIGSWNISSASNLDGMLWSAGKFNQDLSSWCVTNFTDAPQSFADSTLMITNNYPVWGQCGEIYLDDNGVTIKARDNAVVGESYKLTNDGDEYKIVDIATLRQMVADDEDVTKVVTTKVTDMGYLFYYTSNFNKDISSWDVSNVKSMGAIFQTCSLFNQDLSYWDTSNVSNLFAAFGGVTHNLNISNWDVSNVTNMEQIFAGSSIENLDLSNWDTSSVTNLRLAFASETFNSDLSNWDTSNVTNMKEVFRDAKLFNRDISNWDTSNVTTMESMFDKAESFNGDLSSWNTSKVINMRRLFGGAKRFNNDISNWDLSSVIDMIEMFAGASNFNQPLNTWDVSSVISMAGMFDSATAFNQNISNWDTSNVENMQAMFKLSGFNSNIGNWNVSNVTNMNYMFQGNTNFSQNLSNWCVSNITIEPESFSDNSGINNSQLPIWGTCPSGHDSGGSGDSGGN